MTEEEHQKQLRIWATSSTDSFRSIAAATKECPVELLEVLCRDAVAQVRASVGGNISASDEMVRLLMVDQSAEVRAGVASNLSVSQDIIAELSLDRDPLVRRMIAMNPSTPIDVILRLASDADGSVRAGAVRSTRLPSELSEALAADTYEDVRIEVARISENAELLRALAEDASIWVRAVAAKNAHMPTDVLGRLSIDEAEPVRTAVAGNPNTPSTALLELAKDKNGSTIAAPTAANPNTPPEALDLLAGSGYPRVREAVAGNPSTSRARLERMGQPYEPDAMVRQRVAGNPSTPFATVVGLCSDKNSAVRKAALESVLARDLIHHDDCDAQSIRVFAGLPNVELKIAIAGHPEAPDDVLAVLLNDKSKAVRAAVSTRGGDAAWTWPKGVKTNSDRMQVIMTITDSAALGILAKDNSTATRTFAVLRHYELGMFSLEEVLCRLNADPLPGPRDTALREWVSLRLQAEKTAVPDHLVELVVSLGDTLDEVAAAAIAAGIGLSETQLLQLIKSHKHLHATLWAICQYSPLTEDLLRQIAECETWTDSKKSAAAKSGHQAVVHFGNQVSVYPAIFAAMHAQTPEDLREQLRHHSSKQVVAAVYAWPGEDPARLAEGSKHTSALVRAAVASNTAAPEPLLRQLAVDEDSTVRDAVLANPTASTEIRALASQPS